MNIEQNINRYKRINGDSLIQNFIAQANARYILFNTSENRANFPPYTIEDGSLNILAFYYLEIGCSFAENKDLENAREPMERGASILEYVHGSEANKDELSNYYSLISAMSYYVCFQYSKSFILINKTQSDTLISKLITLFLQRKFIELKCEVEKLVINNEFNDDFIAENDEENDGADKIYLITIAKSLDGFIKYLQTGENEYLTVAKTKLHLLKEIAEIKSEPSIWWVIRLLLLISEGFKEASLWVSLSKHFNIESPILRKYIKSLVYLSPRGIHELFITQRKSLPKALNQENSGCIITIPTSSGKTRIAEIAIMDSIIKHPEGKILYIAPFRSLAFEIENTLEKILNNIDITLSHLYGGNLFSRLDEKIIEESNVIIATPEKAKAILRGNREIAIQIKLIVIDEGHLLGPNKRLIVNEVFYEELRFFMEKNGGRFLLLSAVLPNSEDLALWLTKSQETIYKDTWRPSDERLGILEWTGEQVNLNWISNDEERPSYNNKFILREPRPLKKGQTKVRYFPNSKNEAIASTTFKLRSFGTALIFVGLKASVFVMADAYLKCLGNDPEDFKWLNKSDWKAYELACIETYGENNNWLLYAKKGILCHHGALHVDVRLPLERLMRNDKPLVIISTSTLGQGVNLGVSTVVFSTLYQSGELITTRDFWNIAGRAGRAFIDQEAKILIALDKSDTSNLRARSRNNWLQSQALAYFDKEKIDIASSGILALLKDLKQVSENGNIEFDVLLQLISENNIEDLGENAKVIDDILDWIDDTLLALHDLNNNPEEGINYDWIDTFFRNALAYIQIRENSTITKENLISFVKARVKGVIKKVGEENSKWKSIIKSGIPLNSDLFLETRLTEIASIVISYNDIDKTIDTKIEIAKAIIKLISKIPVLEENAEELASEDFNTIISKWLNAEPFSSLIKLKFGEEVIAKLFSYKLPWILNGISKKLRNIELEDEAELIEEISMLIETGLPDLKSIKIYQAGIRSRVCAKEFASLFDDELWNKSIREYKSDILLKREYYKNKVSSNCGGWIDLLYNMSNSKTIKIKTIPNFRFGKVNEKTKILIATEINGLQYLVSPDLSFMQEITKSDIDFSPINNIPGIIFQYDTNESIWKMKIENPYVYTN
jgi:replicative superfamily II helicase